MLTPFVKAPSEGSTASSTALVALEMLRDEGSKSSALSVFDVSRDKPQDSTLSDRSGHGELRRSNDVEKAVVSETKPVGPPPGAFNPMENPDGGLKAWSVVLGGFCCLFCSFGWINSMLFVDGCIREAKLT